MVLFFHRKVIWYDRVYQRTPHNIFDYCYYSFHWSCSVSYTHLVDFSAEVERSLSILDGAVLVVSAVEGVQPQTEIYFKALKCMKIPTIIFINKIDRIGADVERVLEDIKKLLTDAALPLEIYNTCLLYTSGLHRKFCLLYWDGLLFLFELLPKQHLCLI